jgi:hypothetical protein
MFNSLLDRFAPTGKQLVGWIAFLSGLCSISGVTIVALFSGKFPKLALALFVLVGVPTIGLLWVAILRLSSAMKLRIVWGEAIYGGVRWGWDRRAKDVVKGPYCPNLDLPHTQNLLKLRKSGGIPSDGEVIGPNNPLFCPEENCNYTFEDASLSGVPIVTVKERVRIALATLGAWKGRPL